MIDILIYQSTFKRDNFHKGSVELCAQLSVGTLCSSLGTQQQQQQHRCRLRHAAHVQSQHAHVRHSANVAASPAELAVQRSSVLANAAAAANRHGSTSTAWRRRRRRGATHFQFGYLRPGIGKTTILFQSS